MKNKKILYSCVFLLTCILGLSSCSLDFQMERKKENSITSRSKKHITLIAKSTNSAYWKSVYAGASAAATEYNLELVFEGPEVEEDYETQNEMIYEAVEQGTDAIVFSAIDYEENADAINDAANAGVKIIVIDSDVNSKKVNCRISTDNYKAGRTAGQAVLACEDEILNVGIVNFDKITENGQSREKGFRDKVMDNERVNIIESINVLSSVTAAKDGTIQMLKEHPEINVLVTFNEWTSLGVGNAIRELGLAETTTVVAFDSNVVCVDMLETGEVDALIVQNPYAMGYLGVENGYRLISGYKIQEKVIDTSTKLVTKYNMYTEECQRMIFLFDDKL